MPFLADGRVALDAGLRFPSTSRAAGEHWVLAAGRAVRDAVGGSVRSLHPFVAGGVRMAAWADVVLEGARPAVAAVPAERAGELAVRAALARSGLTDADWFRDMRVLLEQHYLAADDPYAQSGKFGGAESWELARRFTAGAVHRSGSFLDLGCANGLLMESMAAWALADRGFALEPYGLDHSAALVELARRRLPRWADRIWVGNAWDWTPPGRFAFVHALPELVPDHLRARWLVRLLDEFLEPGGRLVLRWGDPYPHDPDRRTLPDVLAEANVAADGWLVQERPGRPAVRVAWLEGR